MFRCFSFLAPQTSSSSSTTSNADLPSFLCTPYYRCYESVIWIEYAFGAKLININHWCNCYKNLQGISIFLGFKVHLDVGLIRIARENFATLTTTSAVEDHNSSESAWNSWERWSVVVLNSPLLVEPMQSKFISSRVVLGIVSEGVIWMETVSPKKTVEWNNFFLLLSLWRVWDLYLPIQKNTSRIDLVIHNFPDHIDCIRGTRYIGWSIPWPYMKGTTFAFSPLSKESSQERSTDLPLQHRTRWL